MNDKIVAFSEMLMTLGQAVDVTKAGSSAASRTVKGLSETAASRSPRVAACGQRENGLQSSDVPAVANADDILVCSPCNVPLDDGDDDFEMLTAEHWKWFVDSLSGHSLKKLQTVSR